MIVVRPVTTPFATRRRYREDIKDWLGKKYLIVIRSEARAFAVQDTAFELVQYSYQS